MTDNEITSWIALGLSVPALVGALYSTYRTAVRGGDCHLDFPVDPDEWNLLLEPQDRPGVLIGPDEPLPAGAVNIDFDATWQGRLYNSGPRSGELWDALFEILHLPHGWTGQASLDIQLPLTLPAKETRLVVLRMRLSCRGWTYQTAVTAFASKRRILRRHVLVKSKYRASRGWFLGRLRPRRGRWRYKKDQAQKVLEDRQNGG